MTKAFNTEGTTEGTEDHWVRLFARFKDIWSLFPPCQVVEFVELRNQDTAFASAEMLKSEEALLLSTD
jgi:hypothetical protein